MVKAVGILNYGNPENCTIHILWSPLNSDDCSFKLFRKQLELSLLPRSSRSRQLENNATWQTHSMSHAPFKIWRPAPTWVRVILSDLILLETLQKVSIHDRLYTTSEKRSLTIMVSNEMLKSNLKWRNVYANNWCMHENDNEQENDTMKVEQRQHLTSKTCLWDKEITKEHITYNKMRLLFRSIARRVLIDLD